MRGHVAVGGAVGTLVRSGVVIAAVASTTGGEVLAVLLVNLLGALALGWLVGRARHDPRWARLLPLLGTGVLGSLTTFSALAEQVTRAGLVGEVWAAAAIGLFSLGAGLAAALLGFRLGMRTAVGPTEPAATEADR